MELSRPNEMTKKLIYQTGILFFIKVGVQISLIICQLNILYRSELYEIDGLIGGEEGALLQIQKMTSGIYSYIYLYPIYYLFKVFIVVLIITTILQAVEKEIVFFKIAFYISICELLLIFPDIIKIIWFGYINPEDYLRIHFKYFSFGSLANLIDSKTQISPWIWQLLQSVNIWDLGYILLLSFFIGRELKLNYDKALRLIFSSYGVAYAGYTLLVCVLLANL